ncbi:MAG: CoA-binding protein, partial [Candidatus Thermoplasmatota archaeon]
MVETATLFKILTEAKTIVVVGASKNPEKDAHKIPKYLQENGYRIIPVNPTAEVILGEKAYKSLADVREPYDVVDIFRPSEDVPPIEEQANRGPAKVIWMQQGIRNEAAAPKAEA